MATRFNEGTHPSDDHFLAHIAFLTSSDETQTVPNERQTVFDETQTLANEKETVLNEKESAADETQTAANEAATPDNEAGSVVDEKESVPDETQTLFDEMQSVPDEKETAGISEWHNLEKRMPVRRDGGSAETETEQKPNNQYKQLKNSRTMTKKFLNKLMMIKAVLTLLNRNKNVWNKVQDTVTDVNELETLVDEIKEIQKFTGDKADGQTDVKEAEQKKLISQTFNLASALAAMAVRTNNSVLLAKVDFPVSDIERQRDWNQLITAQIVAQLSRENLEALASADITEANVTELETQIEVYSQCMPAKRASTVEMKAANAKIGDLFKQVNKLFKKRLDKMMVRYETSDPEFYAAYQSARIIVDYGTRYEKEASGEQVGEEI